jgi:hypothetical protein
MERMVYWDPAADRIVDGDAHLAAVASSRETSWQACARLHVRERVLRPMARALGYPLPDSRPGVPTTLSASVWDVIGAACIAARKPKGPPVGYAPPRWQAGHESSRAAGRRLGVSHSSLVDRAARSPEGRCLRTAAQWTALAKGLPRRAR